MTTSQPAAAPVADSRGLTAAGAVVVALVLGVVGATYDVATGSGLGTAFAVCFVAGCAIAALRVHREDLVAAVVMPPLVYLLLALLSGLAERDVSSGGFVTSQALELFNALVLGAPTLMAATAAAGVVAAARALSREQRAA